MSWTWIAGWFERLGSQWIVLAVNDCADSPDYVAFFPLQLRTERGREGKFHNELRTGVVILRLHWFHLRSQHQRHAMRAFADHKRLNWTRLHLENIFTSPDRLALCLNEFAPPDFVTARCRAISL
jgi:hypothetical protein